VQHRQQRPRLVLKPLEHIGRRRAGKICSAKSGARPIRSFRRW
jgi:hypothetical protein